MKDDIQDYRDIEFVILEKFENGTMTAKELTRIENSYIKKYDSIANGYNVNVAYPNLGRIDFNSLLYSRKRKA